MIADRFGVANTRFCEKLDETIVARQFYRSLSGERNWVTFPPPSVATSAPC